MSNFGTSGPRIASGDKYALVALPRLPLDALNLPQEMELPGGLWFAQGLPFKLDKHWPEWIGSVRADQLEAAQLILVASSPSHTPDVLDAENEHQMDLVRRLYQGLEIATPIWVDGEVMLLTGTNRDGHVDVRQISTLTRPGPTHHGEIDLIGINALKTAATLVPIISDFPPKKYLRLCRVLNAYFTGVAETDLRERLHQFCRCIEGLIFAEQGKTTGQFKSRTELFVGASHHSFMGGLYENRSAVEHMNDPMLAATNEDGRRRVFREMTLASEEIARYCLLRVLLNPDLRQQYADETSLKAFWHLQPANRRLRWGDPMDLGAVREKLRQRRSVLQQ